MDIDPNAVWLPESTLVRFMAAVFRGLGVPPKDAATCTDVLAAADRLGFDSHGISRLKPIYYDRIREGIQLPVTRLSTVRDRGSTALLDAGNGMGHVAARAAMSLAIRKAKKFGTACVAVRNSTHFGIAGYYALMAARRGCIGIVGTNARPSVAPTFGVENMLGTNPLTFSFPTDEPFPFLLDCATSAIQRGKVEIYAKLGKPLPKGWVVDHSGASKTDPDAVLADLVAGTAALLPVGGPGEATAGYKGYGYSTVVEVLSAALQNGPFLKDLNGRDPATGAKIPYHLGHFFIAIDIAHIIPLALFRSTAGSILRALRASRRAPGADRIYTAGEKEWLTSQERAVKGIPVNRQTQAEMLQMRAELRLSPKRHPLPV